MNRKTTTRNSKLLLFSCAVLLSAAFFCTGCSSQSRSFDQMRLAFRETLVGPPGLDLNDSAVIHRIDRVDGLTKEYWTSMNKTPDRTWLWEDCNVEGISSITLVPYSRLYYMALAVSTPGSEFYGNDSLKRDVIDGMDWMEANRYNPSIPLYDNWWMFVIGTPLNITRVMTLLYDDLTPEQRARYEAAMNHYAPDVTYEGAATGPTKYGSAPQWPPADSSRRTRRNWIWPSKGWKPNSKQSLRAMAFTKTVRSYSTSGILIPEATGARCSKTWST